MINGGLAEKEGEDHAAKETDGPANLPMIRMSVESDGVDTPSRTESLTPTMARNIEKRAARERYAANHQESGTDGTNDTAPQSVSAPITSPSAKPNRKVRPTRRGSNHSFTQKPHGATAMTGIQTLKTGQSPIKKVSGDEVGEGAAGLSSSVSSSQSKTGAIDASGSAYTLAHLPVSTDNLLHHLHTDPRSSHITLSASAGAGVKVPPPASVNPALLTAGGRGPPNSKSGSRNRALSSSSKMDKGKEQADGSSSLPGSRSVSKKPSRETRIAESPEPYGKSDRRRSSLDPKLSLSHSVSSRFADNQTETKAVSPSAIPEIGGSLVPTPSDSSGAASSPGQTSSGLMGYFDHRPRAVSSSGTTRGNGSQGLKSTTSTPMEDWPSHDVGVATDAEHSSDHGDFGMSSSSGDLVAGGLAGTPRRSLEGNQLDIPPRFSARSFPVSPRTTDATSNDFSTCPSDTTSPIGTVPQPESGLVAVTVSDSTAVKLETLVSGDLADKIEQGDEEAEKDAILGAMDDASITSIRSSDQPTSTSTPQARTPGTPSGSLEFVNVDLSGANMVSTPADMTPKPVADAVGTEESLNEEMQGETCINEFSNMIAEVMGTERRSSTGSSVGSSSSKQKKGTTLIGTAGSLDNNDASPRSAVGKGIIHGALAGEYPADDKGKPHTSDWNQFIHAYKSGRWDPNRIPHPPKNTQGSPPITLPTLHSARSSPGLAQAMVSSSVTSGNSKLNLETQGGSYGIASYLTNTSQRPPVTASSASEGFRGFPLAKRNSETAGPASGSSVSANERLSTASDKLRKEEMHPRRRTVEDTNRREFEMYIPTIDPADAGPKSPKTVNSHVRRQGPGQIMLNSGAATMRLAASNYTDSDFSPLSIPSPERELLDPMASALNTEYMSRNKNRQNSSSSDTNPREGKSRSHLSTATAWRGEGEARYETPLYTIAASPVSSPMAHPDQVIAPSQTVTSLSSAAVSVMADRQSAKTATSRRSSGGIVATTRIPPASAPIEWSNPAQDIAPTDYFGNATATAPPPPTGSSRHSSFRSSRTSSSQTITGSQSLAESSDATPELEESSGSLPRTSGDESRTRRTSGADKPRLLAHSSHGATTGSEITTRALFTSHEAPAALPSSDHHERPTNVVSRSQEEEDFHARGFLASPMPHNEAQRRRALYGFRILHTAPDVNFDRIAHLAKLVFSSKIVLISLVDEKENWNKVEIGLGSTNMPRMNTFCGHSILAKNDEPLVILDSKHDWRFASNPYVLGPPYIRFYAGAPLRTTEGFNVGSLCIIDTQPRSEFPPRSRMALKEFAAIVVREMELWRDKTRLKARDRIQTSMEQFTRECLELDNNADASPANAQAKMDRVYDRASKLVQKTLEVDGALVLDLAPFEAIERVQEDGSPVTEYQADPFGLEPTTDTEEDVSVPDRETSFSKLPPWTILGASEAPGQKPPNRSRVGSASEHAKFSDFLRNHQEGRIYEHVVPTWIRHMLPNRLQYAMVVPIFNIDKNPFAMLVAYTCDQTKQFLEGFELQFLRAIGVVILSAVLKRRMVLADKAKSNFISNISHELRTPLHGILAAAELLADTPLDANQTSFLKTVQACGNSLVETVNHVLDFTKLSGSKKTTLEGVIRPGVVNLARLVEETVEGCWIGQRARAMQGQSEIGSFYSPPQAGGASGQKEPVKHVETVIDIGLRDKGWQVRCEKGGLRRVLMNLIGNSLKFTSHGYVQVTLRALADEPINGQLPIEMGVIDTGKGISKTFLKEQLFHPFSQENPLQQGTGLGLAIVNSIVRSESVNGKVDVWSSEGLGTEIRVSLNVEVEADPSQDSDTASRTSASSSNSRDVQFGQDLWVSLHNFDQEHRGYVLNQKVMAGYAGWWGFNVLDDPAELGDIMICNEECRVIEQLLKENDFARPVLVLTANRTSRMSTTVNNYIKGGGFAQMVFKPVGPERLSAALQAAVAAFDYSTPSQGTSKSLRSDYFSPAMSPMYPGRSPASSDHSITSSGPHRTYSRRVSGHSIGGEEHSRPAASRESTSSTIGTSSVFETPSSHAPHSKHFVMMQSEVGPGHLLRRRSEEDKSFRRPTPRPAMAPRSTTYHDAVPTHDGRRGSSASQVDLDTESSSIPGSPVSTISLADGGVMLKMSAAPVEQPQGRGARVLLVDDNHINLQLLAAYLKKRNFEYMQAVNGQQSVDAFSSKPSGYWDIILMDISMPIMDGIEATRAIRKVENDRRADRVAYLAKQRGSTSILRQDIIQERCKIFALSGRATQDDKHQAFSAGVDGYLVKPVRLASLDTLFKKLGF